MRNLSDIEFLLEPASEEASSSCGCSDGTKSVQVSECCPKPLKELPAFATGAIETDVGPVSKVSTSLSRKDKWRIIKCRISAWRDGYNMEPGLYAVGEPDSGSDVLVTSNYRYSFDVLRRELSGLDAWILVLDTKGINVWCAAGKGTFGTAELVSRISAVRLGKIVNHRKLILPQLGAAGVSAHEVKRASGFKVAYGPVRAKDVPAYVKNGHKAPAEMRQMVFPLTHRLVLTPMEVLPALKKYPLFALIMLLAFGLQRSGILFGEALTGAWPFLLLGLITIFAGGFLTPVLLPWIPFRSFAVKGWLIGGAATAIALLFIPRFDLPLLLAALLFFPAASSYISLQFTGSTTFTGMSGVKKELRIAIPLYLALSVASILLVVFHKFFIEWGAL